MALEEWLVNTDLFDPDDSFAWHKFYDSIHKQKRIAMRKELLYCLGVEDCFNHNKETRDTELTAASPRL